MVTDRFSHISKSSNVLIFVAIIGFATFTTKAGTYSGGTGEPNNPYLISTVDDFLEMSSEPNDWSSHFLMTNDINLAGIVFDKAPIAPDIDGVYPYNGTMFSGLFDGNGCVIRNFTVNQPSSCFLGIFGRLETHAQLLNIGIENSNITGNFHIGGLVGYNAGGNIRNCYSTGVINGTSYLGGLIGYNYYAKITMSSSSSTINGTAYYVGGIIGKDEVSLIDFCYATGDVNGRKYVGGLLGTGSTHTTIRNCYSTGCVTGDPKGGLISPGGKAINCFWDVEASGVSTSGGGEGAQGKITEEMQNPTTFINSGWDCFGESDNGTADWWTVTIGQYPKLNYRESNYTLEGQGTEAYPYLIYDANDLGAVNRNVFAAYRLVNNINLLQTNWSSSIIPEFYGIFDGANHELSDIKINQPKGEQVGFIGYLGSGSEVGHLCITGVEINSAYDIGGLVGYTNNTNIDNCTVTGNLEATNCTAGGLIGQAIYSTIKNCQVKVNIHSFGHSVGGLIGDNYESTVNNCHSKSTVTGEWANLGGLIGHNYTSTVTNSSSVSTVLATDEYVNYVGGLVGYNGGGSLIDGCFSDGNTTAAWYVGGLVGCISASTVQNSYCSGKVNGEGEVGGLIGLDSFIGSSTITNSYSICSVGEAEKRGAFLGDTYNLVESKYSSSFWNSDICTGLADLGYAYNPEGYNIDLEGVYSLDTTSLKMKQTYVDAGWDFNTPIWTINEGVDYPRLWWESSAEPVDLIADIIESIDDLALQQGLTNSLQAKLDAALKLLEDENENNDKSAVNSLQAFINAVNAQRGKGISEEDADDLINDAQQIIDILSSE